MATSVETFERIIRHQGQHELVPFLLNLAPADVVPVRKRTLALEREWEQGRHEQGNFWRNRSSAAQVLLFFTTSLVVYSRKEALRQGSSGLGFLRLRNRHPDEVEQARSVAVVLDHARPVWLTDWLLRVTRANLWVALDFRSLQNLVSRGLVEPEPWLLAQAVVTQLAACGQEFAVARALLALVSTGKRVRPEQADAWDRLRQQQPALAAAVASQPWEALLLTELQAHSALLEQGVPLLFEFDTQVDSQGARDNGTARVSWLELLPQLAASGHLERGELLTRCLLALRRDFRRPLLTWFKELFLALKPSANERLARQSELTELLAHPLPLVVNFAIEQLKDLWADPKFAAAPLLLNAEGLMGRPDLKTGLKTLLAGFGKLLKADQALIPPLRLSAGSPAPIGVLQADQGLAPTLARLCTAALAHPDAAVQERAAKLLADLLGAKTPLLTADEAATATAALGTYADVLAPAARTVLAPYLDATADAPAAETAAYAPLADFVPDLSAANAVVPVADWHELLFLTGAMLKHEDPSALERWVDGLLRLQARFPADYLAALRPYLKQAFGSLAPDPKQATVRFTGGEFGPGYTGLEQGLLAGWASGFAEPLLENVTCYDSIAEPDPLVWVERWRLRFAEELLRERRGLPLLSTPTHAPHWVAPAVLVEKLLAYEAAGQAPHPADLAVALARTAHAHPSAATARAGLPRLQHEGLRALLDWFLGAAVVGPADVALPAAAAGRKPLLAQDYSEWREQALPPAAATVADTLPWLWAVAARTKQPAAGFPALAGPTEPPYAGGVRPWQPRWEIRELSHTHVAAWKWKPAEPGVTTRWAELHLLDTPAPGGKPSQLLLYSQHAGQVQPPHYWAGLLPLARDYPFLAGLLPQHPAPLHWHTLRLAATRDLAYGPNAAVLGQALRSLLGPGAAFEEPATLLLAVGLINNAATCRALATEALLSGTAHGRLVPAALGGALGQLLAAEYAPVQRLADALTQARGLDPRTDDALAQTLEALLPALPAAPPRNTRLLLDAYAAVRAPRPVPAPVQAQLRAWSAVPSLKAVLKGLLS